MSRTSFAARILRPLQPRSILDIGCREGALAEHLPEVDYWGADLIADPAGKVRYVGDVTTMEFGRSFDAVVALDILEHLENPSGLFDRIVRTAERLILVSLPNTYDLKSRKKFALSGQLGGKYKFNEEAPQDRHRWLMNRSEIIAFYEAKARKYGLLLEQHDLTYGISGSRTLTANAGSMIARTLPKSLVVETVFGLFHKVNRSQ